MKVGETVSLRVQTRAGPTDVVGTLVGVTQDTLRVRRRDGTQAEIPKAQVVTGRVVPPPPAATVGVAELERIAAHGWRAVEVEPLGDWLLRASAGFTRRGNSALALGDPGRPVEDALGAVEAWYAERGLPPRIVVTDPDLAPGLTAELDRRGWPAEAETDVLTTELGPVLRAAPVSGVDVEVADAPDAGWLAAYGEFRGVDPLPDAARQLLCGHDRVGFASVRLDGRTVAVARVAVDGRWAGLAGVAVVEDVRRQGFGSAVSLGALRWAVRKGARRGYLQVVAANPTARAMYERLGFARHHGYAYRVAPA